MIERLGNAIWWLALGAAALVFCLSILVLDGPDPSGGLLITLPIGVGILIVGRLTKYVLAGK
jgi:hypothetical protein